MASTEKATQKAILQYLEYKKIFFYRNNSGAMVIPTKTGSRFLRFGATGSPDIVCVIGGQYVGIEVKDIKGKLSEGQKDFKERLEKAGGKYILARSLEDVLTIHR